MKKHSEVMEMVGYIVLFAVLASGVFWIPRVMVEYQNVENLETYLALLASVPILIMAFGAYREKRLHPIQSVLQKSRVIHH